MRETKFKIGSRPWCVRFDQDTRRYIVYQGDQSNTEIHTIIYEGMEIEHPYYGRVLGKEYLGIYPTRETAVAAALELYKADINKLKADISCIKRKMKELKYENH